MDDYERRANGVVNFLCGAKSDAGLHYRIALVYGYCAYLALERMPLFTRSDEQCGFYVTALDIANDAFWWAERKKVVETKRHLAQFYKFLDDVVDENLVPPRRT